MSANTVCFLRCEGNLTKQFVPSKDQSNLFDLAKCNKMHTPVLQTIRIAFYHTCNSLVARPRIEACIVNILVLTSDTCWLVEPLSCSSCWKRDTAVKMHHDLLHPVWSNPRAPTASSKSELSHQMLEKDVYVRSNVRTNAGQDRSDKTKYWNMKQNVRLDVRSVIRLNVGWAVRSYVRMSEAMSNKISEVMLGSMSEWMSKNLCLNYE